MYLNKEICAKCGGECCKQSGCLLSTRDINNFDDIKVLLTQKSIVIYSIEYNGFILYAFNINDPFTDFFPIRDSPRLKRALSLKKYRNVYIIKTRSENQDVFQRINNPNIIGEKLENGKCVFLTSNGCCFDDTNRPFGGLQLEPDIRGITHCKSHFSILDSALEWLEFHEELDKIFEK